MPEEQRFSPLREYFGVISRRRWYVIGAVIAALLAAMAYSYLRTPQYRATAQLTYQKQADILSTIFGVSSYVSSIDVDRELQTSADLIATKEMAVRAQQLMPEVVPNLSQHVSATAVTGTNVLKIEAVSTNPTQAAQMANAYAAAFTTLKRQQARNQIIAAEDVVQKKLQRYVYPRDAANPGYVALEGRLQDLRVFEGMANGNYSYVAAATVPTAPFVPKHTRDALLGLILGLVVGIALAFLAEQLDVHVHSSDELSEALQLPILGRIPALARGKVSNSYDLLVSVADPTGVAAEAFRMLRGNLDFVNIDGDVRSILITSCSEGEGKTLTATNLAVTLARAGKRVILLELDLRRPKVHRYFGISNRVGLSDVVAGRTAIADAMQSIELAPIEVSDGTEGARAESGQLRVLTSGGLPPNPGEIVTSKRIASIIRELTEAADIVLVDSPPFFAVGDAVALSDKVDGLLLVAKMEHVTKGMVKEASVLLRSLPCRRLGIAATNFGAGGTAYHYRYQTEGETEAAPRVELQGAQTRP